MFGLATTPSLRRARLRRFVFLVRMCRLKERWCVIFPVPVTLNLFLALELVLTFGILNTFKSDTLLAPPDNQGTFWALWAMDGAFGDIKWSAKVGN